VTVNELIEEVGMRLDVLRSGDDFKNPILE
jgi:hypothetical protein